MNEPEKKHKQLSEKELDKLKKAREKQLGKIVKK